VIRIVNKSQFSTDRSRWEGMLEAGEGGTLNVEVKTQV
jgi:hypothetical protein